MDEIRRNTLIMLNQVISFEKIQALVNDDDYCRNVYKWIINSDINRLKNIVNHPEKHKEQLGYEFLRKQLEYAGNNGIRIVTFCEEDYPERLKNIYQPPPVIYIRGKFNLGDSLAVVGTRKATPYGRNAVRQILPGLISEAISIISGMAYGIDYYAQKICIECGGYTIGVLGTGIDIIYPSQNKALYEMIIGQGSCLLSEFPIGFSPTKYSFLQRNRIISGLADAVLVVESREKGGALSTANFALEQGKDVFSVPGSIFSLQSAGCNNLIKQGAFPVTDPDDILFVLGKKNIDSRAFKETYKKNISISEEEKKILQLLDRGYTAFDMLLDNLSFEIGYLYNLLFDLERKGYIRREAGNRYFRILCKGDS